MSKDNVHGRDLVFKAIADPTRRRILRILNSGEMTAGEIASHFAISAPSMSHHFNALKAADLIRARREGQQIHYSLNTTVVQDLLTVLMDIFGKDTGEEK
jgi:DNA-binding transcriptional ArsR family regulator